MSRYFVLVDGARGAYGVTVPDMPGCTSAGATVDEALRNAMEALQLWASDALADGETLPVPRSAEAVRAEPDVAAALAAGAALAIVPLILDAGRPANANLSLDAGLLAAIDEARDCARVNALSLPRQRRARKARQRRLMPLAPWHRPSGVPRAWSSWPDAS